MLIENVIQNHGDDEHCHNYQSQIYIGLPRGNMRPKIQLYLLCHLVYNVPWLI